MNEIEKKIEEQASNNINNVHDLIDKKVNETDNVKSAIDLLATKTALGRTETLDKVVEEKEEELRNDAEAKRVQAEAGKISQETEKSKKEKERELAELDRIISTRKAEADKLKVDGDIAQAFFNSNKDILKYLGVREKKSLKTMQALMFPASIIFIIIQILLFPLTFCGILLETVFGIVGGVCGTIKNNALKFIITTFVVLLIISVGFCAYYFGGKIIFK